MPSGVHMVDEFFFSRAAGFSVASTMVFGSNLVVAGAAEQRGCTRLLY